MAAVSYTHLDVYKRQLVALECESTDPNAPEYAPILELMDAVDKYIPTPERKADLPFLMPVEDVFTITAVSYTHLPSRARLTRCWASRKMSSSASSSPPERGCPCISTLKSRCWGRKSPRQTNNLRNNLLTMRRLLEYNK